MPSVRLDNIHDPRVRLLAAELEIDEYSALGRLAHVFEYCTERCAYSISIKMLGVLGGHSKFSDALLAADLAEVDAIDPAALRIRGTEGRIEWHRNRQESARIGGKARAAGAPRDENGHFAPAEPAIHQRPTSDSPAEVPAPASPTTKAKAKAKNQEEEDTQPAASAVAALAVVTPMQPAPPARAAPGRRPRRQVSGELVREFVGTYVDAYRVRYRTSSDYEPPDPDISPQVIGNIQRFLAYTPVETACDLIRVYCAMKDPWFEKKNHDFETFRQNLNKVRLAKARGRDPTERKSTLEVLQEMGVGEESELPSICGTNRQA